MFLVTKHFSIDAEFTDGGDGACKCCEYRQYVRGYKKRKPPGQKWQTEQLFIWGGVPLSKDVYHEDGDPTKRDGVFGHRDIKCPVDSYGEDEGEERATGCRYHADDAPGEAYITGTEYEIHLEFMGVIIDVCNSNSNCAEKEWTIDLKGKV